MKTDKLITQKIVRDASISVLLYALPVLLMLLAFYFTDERPWIGYEVPIAKVEYTDMLSQIFTHLSTWGLPVIMVVVGIIEFIYGLYENHWSKNERMLDIVCFVVPKILVTPFISYVMLLLLPVILPGAKDMFGWVPFWWGFLIIAVADDLTQYWYHRFHHQVPWLWRFHRTHHSAPYMGMAMASRQNFLYTIFFSQIYLTAGLVYLGLGFPALFVKGVKSLITTAAHSSIKWDKPFYTYKLLKPIGWVMERVISTPATHHAHHADTDGDGVGHYKGNFGNMFFIWDVMFGTGIITRKYPSGYGIKHYKQEEWYAQFLWPIFKSKKKGSELSPDGPMVGDAVIDTKEINHLKKEVVTEEQYVALGAHV